MSGQMAKRCLCGQKLCVHCGECHTVTDCFRASPACDWSPVHLVGDDVWSVCRALERKIKRMQGLAAQMPRTVEELREVHIRADTLMTYVLDDVVVLLPEPVQERLQCLARWHEQVWVLPLSPVREEMP